MRVDLHIHSCASDGCWTPGQILAGVQAMGIGLFSVTDHDSTDSLAAVEAGAQAASIAFVRGVEISSAVDSVSFHILGYRIDPRHVGLQALLARNRQGADKIDRDHIKALIRLGYNIKLEDYDAYSFDRTRGGFKSYNYCLDRDFCSSLADWLKDIGCHMKRDWSGYPHPAEVIAAIRSAGGLPILAHPGGSLQAWGGVSEKSLAPFIEFGIAGLEAYSCYHSPEMNAFCADWCAQHDLLCTAGSDYHGGFAGRALGVPEIDSRRLRLEGIAAV